MHLVKIVFAFLAVGGTGYALFRLQHDAPAWVKVLGTLMGVATLIVAITYLPQAVDALETSAERVSRWFEPSPEQIRRRAGAKAEEDRKAREVAARRQEEEEARKRAADELARQQRETEQAAARHRELEMALQREKELAAAQQRERDLEAARQREREQIAARRREAARQRELAGTGTGRTRQGEFIPTCPVGMGYSREYQRCIPAQNLGGVIPCSADDQTFVPGRGWVSNCR